MKNGGKSFHSQPGTCSGQSQISRSGLKAKPGMRLTRNMDYLKMDNLTFKDGFLRSINMLKSMDNLRNMYKLRGMVKLGSMDNLKNPNNL